MAQTLEFRRLIQAPAAEAYRAFTRATPLRDWLCDVCLADGRVGGRIYLWWNRGYYAAGEFVALEENRRVAFTWQGKDEPAGGQVEARFEDHGAAIEVILTHSGIGEGPAWERAVAEYERGWTAALENLQSLLETGQDLRYTRRPMLGVLLGDLTDEEHAAMGIPIAGGIRLSSAVPGMAAANAGLLKDDVVVSVGGRATSDYPALVLALQGRHAGDVVDVVYHRGAERREAQMTLSARLLPEIPPTPAALAEKLRELNAGVFSELEAILADVDEAQAAVSPAPHAWSAAQAIAHLVISERETHVWLTDMINDDERFADRYTNATAATARVNGLLAAHPTLPELLSALRAVLTESEAMVACLPDELVGHKGNYWRIGHNLLQGDEHWKEHLEQIEEALASAK